MLIYINKWYKISSTHKLYNLLVIPREIRKAEKIDLATIICILKIVCLWVIFKIFVIAINLWNKFETEINRY